MSVETSKSVVIHNFGGYDSLKIQEYDLPPLDNHIEIKVEYAGLNFADLYTRQGLIADKKRPFILGMECTGIITDIGLKDTKFKVGDRVVCYNFEGGMYSQKIRIKKENCFSLPDHVTFETGAAILVNYLTAYFSIYELGNLKENQSILILSCAGGVGWAATQFSKIIGATIYGTGSANKEKLATENGVNIFLPNENLENEIKNYKFDLILSNQAGPFFELLQDQLKPLGKIICLGANNFIKNEEKLSIFSLVKSWWSTKNISVQNLILNNRSVSGLHLGLLMNAEPENFKKALNFVFELLKDQKIIPKVDSIYSMDKIVLATKILAERKNIGKVLLKINE